MRINLVENKNTDIDKLYHKILNNVIDFIWRLAGYHEYESLHVQLMLHIVSAAVFFPALVLLDKK